MTIDNERPASHEPKTVSRRKFLKLAGAAGATAALGLGGGLVAGCGEATTTTTTGAAPSTTAGPTATTAAVTTTSAPATTTSVSTSAESGRPLKVGTVYPQTGSLAVHGIGASYASKRFDRVLPDGLVCGDGKRHAIEIVSRDTQSDSNRSAQVTADLITNDKVDVIVSGGGPDTYMPSADTCEALGCPSLNNAGPWQAFWFERKPPAEGFKWTWGNLLGSEQTIYCFCDMFSQVPNNKVAGLLLKNDAEGAAWGGENSAPAALKSLGYTVIQPDLYPVGTDDFTAQIKTFKNAGCEVLTGANNPTDFTNFWSQAIQQGFHPKCASSGNALLFPQTLDAIGPRGIGLIGEIGWHASFPWTDSLNGDDCPTVAADFEKTMNLQHSSGSVAVYTMLEWAVDLFRRATNPEDKESVVAAVKGTKLNTISGPIDFTTPVDQNPMDPASHHPVINAVKQPFAAGQWVKGTGKWPFELVVCSTVTAPGCKPQATTQPMTYES